MWPLGSVRATGAITGHMWLLLLETCKFKLLCATSVKCTPDFADLVQVKGCKISHFADMIVWIYYVKLDITIISLFFFLFNVSTRTFYIIYIHDWHYTAALNLSSGLHVLEQFMRSL